MTQKFKKLLFYPLKYMAFLLVFSCLVVQANEIQKNESELKAIQKQIKNLQGKIKNDEKLLSKERGSLQDVEIQIASINKKQTQTQAQINEAQAKQLELKAQADLERARVTEELSRMSDLVLSQHSMGDQGYLKLLLGQQDPASIERTMVYYKYLAQFTSKRVNNGREQVKELVALEQKVNQQQEVLDSLLANQRNQQDELKQAKTKRKQAIASLDNQLTKSANRVGRLQEDENRIKRLVKGLQAAAREREKARQRAAEKAAKEQERLAAKQTTTKAKSKQTTTVIKPIVQRVSNAGLGKLKGQLKMPAQGPIVASYGSIKQGSGVKWNGIMLGVNQGEPVRSIYNGQIVYADWFKGFGQLVIVDHGQGYMSLYSHNNIITRSLGEQIKANEIIAYSGSSGGLAKPGLYFEVRYNGEPRDPLLWVKR